MKSQHFLSSFWNFSANTRSLSFDTYRYSIFCSCSVLSKRSVFPIRLLPIITVKRECLADFSQFLRSISISFYDHKTS